MIWEGKGGYRRGLKFTHAGNPFRLFEAEVYLKLKIVVQFGAPEGSAKLFIYVLYSMQP